jgi:hypothetical protein
MYQGKNPTEQRTDPKTVKDRNATQVMLRKGKSGRVSEGKEGEYGLGMSIQV